VVTNYKRKKMSPLMYDLMVCALDSGWSAEGLRLGQGHCVVFLGKT